MWSNIRSEYRIARAGVFVAALILAASCGGGGDVGAPQPQPQPNPAPTLTSVSPDQVLLGQPATLTIKGSGFVQGSSVSWRNQSHAATYVDASTLTVNLSASDVPTTGEVLAIVVNPSPGGGTSSSVIVTVVNSIPVITSISPTNGASGANLSGAGLQVTITGTGFISESVPMWDTQRELPRSDVTATTITAILSADLLSVGGTHQLWVKNKTIGGGGSNKVDFTVLNAVPSITALVPDPATPGGAFQLLVVGKGFMRNSVVRWNGADRPTSYEGGNLYADIPASDVSAPGAATITVYNPPPQGGTSAPATLTIRQAPLSVVGTIDLENIGGLARDSTRNLLYAAVPNGAPTQANTIAKIDPTTATVVGSLAIGLDPRRIAISDDDRYLYVALRTTPKIVRIDLATFTKDLEFDPGASFAISNGIGDDMVVLPGAPRTVAVVVRNVGVVLFDDGVARINATATKGVGKGANIVRGPDGSHVYGYNDLTTLAQYGNLVTATGLTVESTKTGLLGYVSGAAYDAGRLYATNGKVVDPVALTLLGTYQFNTSAPSAVAPDARHGRVHFLSGAGIATYSTQGFNQLDWFESSFVGLNSLTRWGTEGLAVGNGTKIVILRGTQVAP